MEEAARCRYQISISSNRLKGLKCDDTSTPITERYDQFDKAVAKVAEKVVGKRKPCGMPSWVSDETLRLREERDKTNTKLAKKQKVKRDIEETQYQPK